MSIVDLSKKFMVLPFVGGLFFGDHILPRWEAPPVSWRHSREA